MSNTLKKYAVVGNPISHSLSPKIHQSFADQFNFHIRYEKIEIEPLEFSKVIKELIGDGYIGFNVTLPFKVEAFKICDHLSQRAQYSKSVNTLTIKGKEIYGDTTDGPGLVRDLINREVIIKDKLLLLIGAGGAAQAVMYDLIQKKPTTIYLTNRTLSKSYDMSRYWQSYADENKVKLKVLPPNESPSFDLIINATSAGLNDNSPPISSIIQGDYWYDMMYGKSTPFLNQAFEQGASKASGGIGMLIEQAAVSFFIWHKLKPNTKLIYKELT